MAKQAGDRHGAKPKCVCAFRIFLDFALLSLFASFITVDAEKLISLSNHPKEQLLESPRLEFNESYSLNVINENITLNQKIFQVPLFSYDYHGVVRYSIIDGNVNESFRILPKTGEIYINKPLDFDTTPSYLLIVQATDGTSNATTQINIYNKSVVDNLTIFDRFNINVTIPEESLLNGECVATVRGYNPDKSTSNDNEEISYILTSEDAQPSLSIDQKGCLKLLQPFDRDPPNGFAEWQVIISVKDENDLKGNALVDILIEDINDNAPFLNMSQPVRWRTNKEPCLITKLISDDYDDSMNGAPFEYSIDELADTDIRNKFGIIGDMLFARVKFDQEDQTSYNIPIVIQDSGLPKMTGTSTLQVVIDDYNDN